jgi:SAM-dependent methyltransferase
MIGILKKARKVLGSARRAVRFQQNRFRSNGAIFDKIYREARWGGSLGGIYSGSGSEMEVAEIYINVVVAFLKEIGCTSVVDIGCGDFRIGSKIAAEISRYIGADASCLVVERNHLLYSKPGIEFVVCDAERDPLPLAQVCLIRQVLQHLSNASVKVILERLTHTYDYVVVTEHLPSENSLLGYNFDKPTGDDIRAYYGSGIYIDRPPFNFPVEEVLLDFPLPEHQSQKTVYSASDSKSWEHMKTVLITCRRSSNPARK